MAQTPDTIDRALDYEEVRQEFAAMGFVRRDGSPYTIRQVKRMAEDQVLPFFKTPDRRRLIMRSAFLAAVRGWQVAATRAVAERKSEMERSRCRP